MKYTVTGTSLRSHCEVEEQGMNSGRQKKILIIGSLNIDLVFSVPHIVIAGETLHSSALSIYPGGKGANQACAASRTGVRTFFAGRIGSDGLMLRDELVRQGVDCRHLEQGGGNTGQALIQVSDSGENSIILYQGENYGFTRDYADRVLAGFHSGDVIILQNEINLMPYIMEAAKGRGVHVMFNPAPCGPEIAEYPLKAVDTLILNEVEAASLTGLWTDDPEKLLHGVRGRFPTPDIILTLGSRGALYLGKKGEMMIPAEKVQAVDTTSAGDTFIGYYAGALLRGMDERQALETASKAAAICVTRHGAISSIPSWEEVVTSSPYRQCP